MSNRFLEAEQELKRTGACRDKRGARAVTVSPAPAYMSGGFSQWSYQASASDRALVVLLENGGVDLGIPELVEKLLDLLPGSSMLPDSAKEFLIKAIREQLKSFTDNLLENFELTVNRYSAAKPTHFGSVTILRNSTATATDLEKELIGLSKAGKVIDLIILTHGSDKYISVTGGVDDNKIRSFRKNFGKPLSIRSVYMMNCVGSSLNKAWLDAGAKVSSGAAKNNYLPEPTTYYFWQMWKDGKSFQSAALGAYQKTIDIMNDIVRGAVKTLIGVAGGLIADKIDFADFDFVADSAPVVSGDGSLTINSDKLSFAQSMSAGMSVTALPSRTLQLLAESEPAAQAPPPPMRAVSKQGMEFIQRWEGGSGDKAEGAAASIQAAVNEAVQVPLNQNQNDALVCFVMGIGRDNFLRSTLLRLLKERKYDAVPEEMKKWIKVRRSGQVYDDLETAKRRSAEAALFEKPGPAQAQSLAVRTLPIVRSFSYHSASRVMEEGVARYSRQLNPGVVAGIAIADAAQIGLATISVVQSQVAASQGALTLTYDKAQRLLTTAARTEMPGASTTKQSYRRSVLFLEPNRPGQAKADIIIEWEGNAYGEVGTPIVRKNLSTSTEWSKSSAVVTISKIDRIPLQTTDPRTWPIVYTYEGNFDPIGNGMFEFSGEFEINAFGGIKFNRHEVVSRSLIDFLISHEPEFYVKKGADVVVPVPPIPKEQLDYLKKNLP